MSDQRFIAGKCGARDGRSQEQSVSYRHSGALTIVNKRANTSSAANTDRMVTMLRLRLRFASPSR